MPGIASAATAVALAHVAAGTSTIRIGAGGVMLPNHAPLIIAEQFGTLAALHPRRNDLGLDRAPGFDQIAAGAMRCNLSADPNQFPHDAMELLEFFQPTACGLALRVVPGAGEAVEVWILDQAPMVWCAVGRSARPALCLRIHFAPEQMHEAISVYCAWFRPSERLTAPHVMLGLNVFAADTDAEARHLFSSLQPAFLTSRLGHPGKLRPPVDDLDTRPDTCARAMLADALACSVVGGPKTVRHGLQAFIASTTADELKVTAQIFDYDTRKRSFEILARVYGETAEMGEYDDPRGASFSVPVGKPRLDCVGALASGNSDRRPIYCGYQSPCRCGGIFCDLSPPSFQPSVTAPPPSTPIVAKAVEWTMG